MRLRTIEIQNYKSLQNVQIEPSDLTVLVGPNGAGKTNFLDALEFLASVYRYGLETAIANKAGFENIAFRRKRRTKGALKFEIIAEVETRIPILRAGKHRPSTSIKLHHSFSFKAKGTGIGAEFVVDEEELRLYSKTDVSEWLFGGRLIRTSTGGAKLLDAGKGDLGEYLKSRTYLQEKKETQLSFGHRQELFVLSLRVSSSLLRTIVEELSRISVFRFSPEIARMDGTPTPNVKLGNTGSNLPAQIDWLSRKHKDLWNNVLLTMREIIPSLEDIRVEYTPTKSLGLLFKENESSKYWTSKDVSDGTLTTLAILSALNDPRNSLFALEEPENCVHPWIIKQLLLAFNKTSRSKSVFLTTHSPIVIDAVKPSDIWAVYKQDGSSHIKNLTALDPELIELWNSGKTTIANYLDSGLIPSAVPFGAT